MKNFYYSQTFEILRYFWFLKGKQVDDGYHVIYMDENEINLTQDEVREMLHKMDAQNYHGKPKVVILLA